MIELQALSNFCRGLNSFAQSSSLGQLLAHFVERDEL